MNRAWGELREENETKRKEKVSHFSTKSNIQNWILVLSMTTSNLDKLTTSHTT